jgi:hypothetical protein
MNLHDFHLRPTWDHVVPRSRGGRERIVCCHKCNGIKGDMMPDEWRAYMTANPSWWLLTRAERRARNRDTREGARLAKWGPRREPRPEDSMRPYERSQFLLKAYRDAKTNEPNTEA